LLSVVGVRVGWDDSRFNCGDNKSAWALHILVGYEPTAITNTGCTDIQSTANIADKSYKSNKPRTHNQHTWFDNFQLFAAVATAGDSSTSTAFWTGCESTDDLRN
jgi:hypothetical protein